MPDPQTYETDWAVRCHGNNVAESPCGIVCLSHDEYAHQMCRGDRGWYCPNCGSEATWDDGCPATNPPEEAAPDA